MTRYQAELYHYGIKGQKHGLRRFQNEDGSLTAAGKARYGVISLGGSQTQTQTQSQTQTSNKSGSMLSVSSGKKSSFASSASKSSSSGSGLKFVSSGSKMLVSSGKANANNKNKDTGPIREPPKIDKNQDVGDIREPLRMDGGPEGQDRPPRQIGPLPASEFGRPPAPGLVSFVGNSNVSQRPYSEMRSNPAMEGGRLFVSSLMKRG